MLVLQRVLLLLLHHHHVLHRPVPCYVRRRVVVLLPEVRGY